MTGKRGTKRRLAVAYRANREDLEPLLRLLADVLALAALALGHRGEPAGAVKTEGVAP